MASLISMSRRIEKEIHLENADVTPLPLMNLQELRKLSEVCLSLIVNELDVMINYAELKELKKSRLVIRDLILFLDSDIKENQYFSYWHYAGLCFATGPNYLKAINEGKLTALDLSLQTTWDNPNFEVGIIGVNFVAGKLYPNALARFHNLTNEKDVNILDVSRFLKKRIKILHEQAVPNEPNKETQDADEVELDKMDNESVNTQDADEVELDKMDNESVNTQDADEVELDKMDNESINTQDADEDTQDNGHLNVPHPTSIPVSNFNKIIMLFNKWFSIKK